MRLPDVHWSRGEVFSSTVYALTFLVLAVLYVCFPLADPDFWWHLKTGELIVESRGLLPGDPFCFTSDPQVSPRERLILDGYWLWQVMAYGFYVLGGLTGIKVFNGLTLLTIYASIGAALRHFGVRRAVAVPLMAASLLTMFGRYYLERPQIFSFLLATLIITFLMCIRRGERPSWWLYPVMVLWGNLHGGVVVGSVLLVLFALGSVWDLRGDRGRLLLVLRWAFGGVLCSLLHPGGIDTYLQTLNFFSEGMDLVAKEFRSSFVQYAEGDKTLALLCWGFVAVNSWALWRSRSEAAAADLLVFCFIAWSALFYIRNIPFLAVSLLPLSGHYLHKAFAVGSKLSLAKTRTWIVASLLVMLLYLAFFTATIYRLRGIGEWGVVGSSYPQVLVNFLKENHIRGNVFNNYNWGGFFIWNLYPYNLFFIDTRAISREVVDDYNKIYYVSVADNNGQSEYLYLLNQYQVQAVVMNLEEEDGGVSKLLKYLLVKPQWVPVYHDGYGYVLLKTGTENAAMLQRHQIDKRVFLERILAGYNKNLHEYPNNANRYLGRGDLLSYMGRYDEAERDFAMVRQLAPGHPELSAKVQQLAKLREKAGAR